jgi:hypothetical protein
MNQLAAPEDVQWPDDPMGRSSDHKTSDEWRAASRRNAFLRGLCALCGEPREEDRTHAARSQWADQVKTARKTRSELGVDESHR